MKNIKEFNIDYRLGPKPKNWSRKLKICKCNIPVYFKNDELKVRIDIKYLIEFNDNKLEKRKSTHWYSSRNTNKDITHFELPDIFHNLSNNDFKIILGYFSRGGEEIPSPIYIKIKNEQKFNSLFLKNKRKIKLKKLFDV